jgi:hypothetical protein
VTALYKEMWPVHENEWLAERFEENRGRLRSVTYRMLGWLSEADDAVQEAWLKFGRSGASGMENPRGWLIGDQAADAGGGLHLGDQSRRQKDEDHVGSHAALQQFI